MRPSRALFAPLALVLTAALAAPVDAANPVDADRYHNPLKPQVPNDGVVETCADPTVLHGQRPTDRRWYLYCTSDPLNDQDKNAEGNWNFHPIPMMQSRDLVNWKYVGDALPQPPSWAAEGSGLWAPDIVYSRAHHQYYLTFVVTDTKARISGVEDCTSDSAIGVATSPNPTGPWELSGRPVIPPRQNGEGCNFFWTYDPDVLGDAVSDTSVLYYGSYYGGIWGREVKFTPRGMTATSEPTQITIGNRYEGANVIQHGGWYYLFASAANCCNGPLTGYSVFAGRSRDPLGPYVDREGNSLLAGRVGGTPVISMNGNRWVGPGHNTVFRDFDGQWWTVYHAIDRSSPYLDPTINLNRRPAMLDPVDWVNGWPTVRAGRWASDRRMPAPAAQPGEQTRYQPNPVQEYRPGRQLDRHSDEFEGDSLDPQWSWVRQPAPETYGISNGRFHFETQAADLYVDSNDASVLTEPAPDRDYVVETRVRLNVPPEGCPQDGCFNYAQAGLVIYRGDNRFIKLVHASIWETRQTEFAKEVRPPQPEGFPRYGNTVVGPPADWTYLRVVKRAVQRGVDGPSPEFYTAYTSQDGQNWVRGGTWRHSLGDQARIGLVSMGRDGFLATFDYVRVSTVRTR